MAVLLKKIIIGDTYIRSALLICFIVVIILPILIGDFYALPSADDFSNANQVSEYLKQSNSFVAACKVTWNVYLTWQGTFTSCFLLFFIRPFETVGLVGGRIFLCISTIFLAASILWFASQIAKKLYGMNSKNVVLFMQAVFIFVAFEMCRGGQEIFYWYTGACVYTIPMGLTFCSFSFYVQYLWEKHSLINAVFLCILAFLASGGILQITALLCCGMLILWFTYLKLHKNKEGILAGSPFGASLIGALINAFAPGNFVRHAYLEEGVHIFGALKSTIVMVMTQFKRTFTENPFLLYVILFCFLVSLFTVSKSAKTEKQYYPGMFAVILLGGLIISVFPICLGYGENAIAEGGIPLRNTYICDLYVGIGSAICSWEFGGWLGIKKGYSISKKEMMLTFMCIMLIFFKTGGYIQLFDEASGKTFYQLYTGDIQRCVKVWREVLDEIENSESNKAEIEVPKMPDIILKIPELSEDETGWVNQSVARYYNKESIVIKFVGK